MRVIIAGGRGLIGSSLAAALVRDGHEPIVLSRAPEQPAGLPSGVRAVRWDARSPESWRAWADGAEAIVNLAGEPLDSGRWTAERKRAFLDSRANAGRAIAAAVEAASHKPRVLIQASAVGYYGPRGDEEIDEAAPPGSDFLARLALDWEASTRSVEDHGVRRALIRTGLVLSTRSGALPKLLLPFRFGLGGPFGSGRQWWPWIHLDDEVAAIRFLIDREEARGPYNLVAPQPVTNQQFSRTLGRALRRPALLPAPAPILKIILGEMATVVLDGQRAVPRRLQELGFPFRFLELEPALRDLLQRRA